MAAAAALGWGTPTCQGSRGRQSRCDSSWRSVLEVQANSPSDFDPGLQQRCFTSRHLRFPHTLSFFGSPGDRGWALRELGFSMPRAPAAVWAARGPLCPGCGAAGLASGPQPRHEPALGQQQSRGAAPPSPAALALADLSCSAVALSQSGSHDQLEGAGAVGNARDSNRLRRADATGFVVRRRPHCFPSVASPASAAPLPAHALVWHMPTPIPLCPLRLPPASNPM